MIRQWKHYLWHIILQSILFVYWLAVAVWLQVAFGNLSGRECRTIFGDSVCRRVSQPERKSDGWTAMLQSPATDEPFVPLGETGHHHSRLRLASNDVPTHRFPNHHVP